MLTWNFLANNYWTFKDFIYYAPSGEKHEYQVTVIIPAYNKQKRIEKTLKAVNKYFLSKPVTRQIIVVDDGSGDNTAKTAEHLMKEIEDLSIIKYNPNRGKGYAIKRGVEAVRDEYTLLPNICCQDFWVN